ncbi:MAG: hypothetical protein J7L32_02550, partial [Thermoplasmata archaeon]|nr:hypothetical protein [Thermoplasmata archaeon]
MKRLIWFGLLFFSLGWSFLLPFFYPVDYTLGIASMVVGLLFMLAGAKDFSPIVRRFDKRYTILLIPLVISLFFIGFPFNIGIVILVAAIALYALFDRLRVKHVFIPLGLILSGIVLSVQAALIPFYEMVASRYHDCSAISPLMAGLINLFGLRSSVSSGTVFVYTPDNVYPFTVTTGKLGLFFWLLIFAGAVLFFLLSDRKKESAKSLTVFLAISLVYLVLRFITLVFVYTEVESLSIFWAPIPLFVSFIPLILLFMVFVYLPDLTKQSDIFRDFKIKKHMVLAVFTFFIFVFLLVG